MCDRDRFTLKVVRLFTFEILDSSIFRITNITTENLSTMFGYFIITTMWLFKLGKYGKINKGSWRPNIPVTLLCQKSGSQLDDYLQFLNVSDMKYETWHWQWLCYDVKIKQFRVLEWAIKLFRIHQWYIFGNCMILLGLLKQNLQSLPGLIW